MINASGGVTQNQSTSTTTTTGSAPTFPTHNPAMQHQQFMNGGASTVTTTTTTPNPIGAMPPAPPKFPDPTKNLIKVTSDGSEVVSTSGTGNTDSTQPKKKMNLKMIIGVIILFFVLLGSGVGFYLSQQTQDLRQQASFQCSLFNNDREACEDVNGCTFNPSPASCTVANCTGTTGCTAVFNPAHCAGLQGCSSQTTPTGCANSPGACEWVEATVASCSGTPTTGVCTGTPTGTLPPATQPPATQPPSTTPPSGLTCPNPPHLPAAAYVKFTCPNGCTQTTEDGVTAWRCYENRQDSTTPLSLNGVCGQVDVLSQAGNDGSYCGYSEYTCDQPQCQPGGGGTPTPVPPQISCNDVCSSDTQCPANLKCLSTYDFNAVWEDSTASVANVGSGTITGFKAFVRNGVVEQYMARNGVLWYRPTVTTSNWQDVTSTVSSVGTGVITSFSAYVNTSNVVEQWLTRGGQVWYRPNTTATWQNISANFASVGSGTIYAYTVDKYSADHGNIVSGNLVKGTQTWHHTSSNWNNWVDVTSNLTSIPGSSGYITSHSFHVNPNGSIRHHSVIGSKVWVRAAMQTEAKRCRLATYPNSTSCVAPTATPQDVACTGMTGVLKTGPITNLTAPLSYSVTSSGSVNKVELVAHGNFTPPAMSTGWATIATDTTPGDNSFTGTTTYGQMVDALVATGHDRQKLMTSGIVYFANVYGPKGFCTGANTWSIGGGACTRNTQCTGTALLTTTATSTPTATPTATPPVITYQCNTACSTDAQCQGALGSTYSCYKVTTSLLADSSAGNCRLTANPTATNCTAAPVVCNSACTPTSANDNSLLPADDICTKQNPLWSCDPTSSKCRLTANPTSVSCDPAPLVCNSPCDPNAKSDLCTAANDTWYCDSTSSRCRFETNPASTSCQPPVGAVACNQACTSNAQCTSTNANYTCDSTSNTCRLSSNPTSTTCEAVPPKCNEACSTNAQCEKGDPDHYCDTTTNTCRLETNPTSTTCSEPVVTPTPTPAPGCNDTCVTNADCSNTNHICATTEDSTLKCRLSSYPTSNTCTLPTTSTAQPTLPPALLQTGPEDWMNWLKAGLVTLGLGAALFFLL